MKVGFMGASGTGKTALAEEVARQFGLPINPVGARSVARAMGFASPYDVDRVGKRAEFQKRFLEEKLAWEEKHSAFVTDRTPMDLLAYTIVEGAIRDIDQRYVDACGEGYLRYDVTFRCPVDAHQVIDPSGVHEPRVHYHRLYEQVLIGLALPLSVPSATAIGEPRFVHCVTLDRADLDLRKKVVTNAIRYFAGVKEERSR